MRKVVKLTVVQRDERYSKGKAYDFRHTIEYSPADLLVFLDETGHETLSDPNYPVFGIGGCAVSGELYESAICVPWKQIKDKHFGGAGKPLHASEIDRGNLAGIEAIAEFFRRKAFFRLASLTSVFANLSDSLTPYQVLAPDLMNHVLEALVSTGCKQIRIVFEASQRAEHLQWHYFQYYGYGIHDGKDCESFKVKCIRMGKEACEPGLEVADFIMNAAGGETVARWTHKGPSRRDYIAVFCDVDQTLVKGNELIGPQGS